MIIKRSRTLRFSPAKYEHIEISGEIELDTDEVEDTESTYQDAIKMVNALLDDLLQEDLDRADEVSLTPEDETFVHQWKDAM